MGTMVHGSCLVGMPNARVIRVGMAICLLKNLFWPSLALPDIAANSVAVQRRGDTEARLKHQARDLAAVR